MKREGSSTCSSNTKKELPCNSDEGGRSTGRSKTSEGVGGGRGSLGMV